MANTIKDLKDAINKALEISSNVDLESNANFFENMHKISGLLIKAKKKSSMWVNETEIN